ncbi:Cupredoxin, partial [Mycena vulgaris]
VENVRVAPDGLPRDAIQAGSFPGQLIIANKGDVLHLNVSNKLTNPTMRRSLCIHWHGIFQDRTSSEDGLVTFYLPPPISWSLKLIWPATTEYNFPLLEQTGTYYSHLSTQYIDGKVVYHSDDPEKALWDVDDPSTIITLADWYHQPAEALMAQFKVDGHEPVPDSGLINGAGRYVGGPAVPWAVVNVVQGKSEVSLPFSLRVINISGFAAFTFSIDDHTFEVIEADGEVEGVAHLVGSLNGSVICNGTQRCNIALHANASVKNYWIRAPMVRGLIDSMSKLCSFAILRYASAPTQDPTASALVATTLSKGPDPLQEFQLAPLINSGAPGGSAPADHVIDLNFDAPGPGTAWEINGIGYTPLSLPILLNIINGASVASGFTVGEHTFILVPDEVVELRIHGSLHGQSNSLSHIYCI